MIVQITPVAPGRSHVTTTASSAKKPSSGGDDGGSGGLATGASGRTPVCRCNTQYKLSDLKALQQLQLQQQQQQQHQQQQQGASATTNVSSSTPAVSGTTPGSSTAAGGHHHHHPSSTAAMSQHSHVGSAAQKQSQELTNEELIKYLQQINADIKWIEQLKQYKYEIEKLSHTDKTDARNIKQQQQHQQQQQQLINGHIVGPPSKPKPDFSAPPSAPHQQTGAISKGECFDRSLKQRHSSRSVDERTARREDEDFAKETGHQRHSSGPSDLQLLKTDISEWLLNLPLKRSVEFLQKAKSAQQKFEKEQQEQAPLQFAKKPLQRQSSGGTSERTIHRQHSAGAGEISLSRNDILEWLKKQQIFSKVNEETGAPKKFKEKEEIPLQHFDPPPKSTQQKQSSAKLQKRHSLGPNEEFFHKSTTDWIQYPLKQLKKHTFDAAPQSSCTDIRRKDRDRSEHSHHRERKLRHSASEVVTSSHLDHPPTRAAPQKPERTFRYQIKERSEPHPQFFPAQQPQHPTQQPSTSAAIPSTTAPKHSRRERSRRHKTQRSATVSDINHINKHPSQQHPPYPASRSTERSHSPAKCTDPFCSAQSLCNDPNCYMYDYYDTPRCASLPRVKTTTPPAVSKCGPLCYECNNKCNSLPRCTDARCTAFAEQAYSTQKIKSNSLPRNAEMAQKRLSREESRSSLPRSRPKKRSSSCGNGKLTKSVSAASLNSRRRRNRSVHFSETMLREVCQNRKLIQPLQQPPSGAAPLQPNIQMLYNFVEGVLSAWVDDEDEHNKSGPDSEPERGAVMKPMHRCNRIRFQTIKRVVSEAAELKGSSKLGNSRYRHRHWRGTAKDCNERFLRKVGGNSFFGKDFYGVGMRIARFNIKN